MSSELILRFTAMGDILLAIPAARALLQQSDCDLHWVIHQRWKPLARFLPAKVHLIKGMSDLLPLVRRFRRLKPLRVHDLQGKLLSRAIVWLVRPPIATRYIKRSWNEQLAALTNKYPLKTSDSRPVWKRFLDTVGLPNAQPDGSLVFGLSPTSVDNLLNELGLQKYSFLILHPGASHPGKVLPAAALDAMAKLWPRIVVIGDRTDIPLPSNMIDLRGNLPLELLPGLMKSSKGVVSTDSGPLHLARATGVPVAGIYLQTDPSLGFTPLPGPDVTLVSLNLHCKPCSLHGERAVCPEGHWACRNLDWPQVTANLHAWFADPARITNQISPSI